MIRFFRWGVCLTWHGRNTLLLTKRYLIRWNRDGEMISRRWRA